MIDRKKMDENELKNQVDALKRLFGPRVKQARKAAGYSSQEKMANDAIGFDKGTVRDVERAHSGASFSTLVEISELTGKPIASFFPTYLLSQQTDDRIIETDLILAALTQLDYDDILALRVLIERLVEHRKTCGKVHTGDNNRNK